MKNFFDNSNLTRTERRERKRTVNKLRKNISKLGDKYRFMSESLSDDQVYEIYNDIIRTNLDDTYRLHLIYNNMGLKGHGNRKLKNCIDNFIERSDNKLKRTIKLKGILNEPQ